LLFFSYLFLGLPPGGATAARLDINTATESEPTPGDILILADSDYFPALLGKIRQAEANIDLTMFVFKATKSGQNRPGMIAEELIAAAQRGVQVRVFLEKSGYDNRLNETNQFTAKRLRDKGIKVIFDSPEITTHAKLVVIDQRYSFVGSHNFTHAALKYNNELSLLIDNRDLAHKVTEYMTDIINQ
jgi:phosphatidylserine/phosphatidylglycerophosphate/cardiolipin synthase-like enzyme